MAEQVEASPKHTGAFFDLLIEIAMNRNRENGEFTVPGLGKLVKAQRAARMGRNPATGDAIRINGKTTVKFRLSKSAKDAVVPPKAWRPHVFSLSTESLICCYKSGRALQSHPSRRPAPNASFQPCYPC